MGATCRVLVVDDDPGDRHLAGRGLAAAGFEVQEVGSAEDAITRLGVDRFDFVLSDLMMPGQNGLELAREVRERFPRVRVLLMSGYHLSERQLRHLDVGVIAFVPKPLELRELATFLRRKTHRPQRGSSRVIP